MFLLIKIKPIGITPKQRVMNQDLQKSDHWEIDKSDRINSTEYMWSVVINKTNFHTEISDWYDFMNLIEMSKSVKHLKNSRH